MAWHGYDAEYYGMVFFGAKIVRAMADSGNCPPSDFWSHAKTRRGGFVGQTKCAENNCPLVNRCRPFLSGALDGTLGRRGQNRAVRGLGDRDTAR